MKGLASIWFLLVLAGCHRDDCLVYDGECNPFVTALLFSRVQAARFIAVSNSTGGSVSMYQMNYSTGTLSPVSGSPFAAGASPHHLAAHPSGRFLYLANNGSNNISGYAVNSNTGALTQVSGSPFASVTAPYSVTIDPTGTYLYAGSETTAFISAYQIDSSTGVLTQISGSPFGASPVAGSVRVSPSGRFLYVGVNNATGQVLAYAIASNGSLTTISGSPFASGNDTISVTVDPYERFVLGINYFTTNIYSYSIGPGGALTTVGIYSTGSAPGYVTVEPSGRFVYVANSGDATGLVALSAYFIGASGAMIPLGAGPYAAGASPIGCAAEPLGRYVFSANTGSNTVTMHTINQTSGVPTIVGTYSTGNGPFGVSFIPTLQY